MRILLIVMVACSVTVAQTTSPALDVLRANIRLSESKLDNIRVESRYQAEGWNTVEIKWKFAAEADVTAWYTGIPGSKARIDFHKRVLPWVDGAAPFSSGKASVAYNGRVGQRLSYTVGNPKELLEVLRGEVLADRPNDFGTFGGDTCGWTFSIYGVDDYRNRRLSSVFETLDAHTTLTSEEESFQGIRCVKLTEQSPGRTRVLRLDTEHGYALRGIEQLNNGKLRSRIVVRELSAAAKDIYYPCLAIAEVFTATGVPLTRATFHAQKIVVNDPDFDEAVFTLRWPKGAMVRDTVANRTFRVAGNPGEQAASVSKQVARVRATTATTPVPTSADPKAAGMHPVRAKNTPGAKVETGRSMAALIWGGAGAIMLVAIGLWILRRWRAVAILGAMLTLTSAEAIAQFTDTMAVREMPVDLRFDNCGVNTAMFLLEYFERPANVDGLAASLQTGRAWERPVTMLSIKEALTKAGLSASSYQSATLNEVIGMMNRDNIAIIHLRGTSNTAGHYLLLACPWQDSLLVINPGQWEQWKSFREIASQWGGRMSGYFLLVSNVRSKQERTYTLLEKTIQVDMGNVEPGSGPLIVPVQVAKGSEKPAITITNAAGSCGCFRTAKFRTGGMMLREAGDVLDLTFERSELSVGAQKRLVLLDLQSAGRRWQLPIEIAMNVAAQRTTPSVTWFPRRIDYGVISHDAMARQQPEIITVAAPSSVTLQLVASTSSALKVTEVPAKVDDSNKESQRTVQFSIALNVPKKGPFRETLMIKTSDAMTPTIEVSFTGEIR